MRGLILFLLVASLALIQGAPEPRPGPEPQFDFIRGAYGGTRDMFRAYNDMKDANWKNSDKYFHARGNQDAARHGPGGAWAARTISNAREFTDRLRGQSAADSRADQRANVYGRNGGNLDIYRPRGLPSRY